MPWRATIDTVAANRKGADMFKRIVVALDGSQSSQDALAMARRLAEREGGSITAVHVVEIMAGRSAGYTVHPDEEEIGSRIAESVDAAKQDGIDATLQQHQTVMGGPGPIIARVARETNADVIVSGTRGHSRLAGMLLGSVTQKLLHLAPCPVLVVPAAENRKAGEEAADTAAAAG
jgi:nucleotide-binding universal stress UspA family protein